MNKGVIAIICLLIGSIMGFMIGVGYGIDITIHKAMSVLPYFTTISIDEKAVKDALFMYNNRLAGCLPKKELNAPIYSD